MAVGIEHYPDLLLRLELCLRRAELDRVSNCRVEIVDLEVEVQYLLRVVLDWRPCRADILRRGLERDIGNPVGWDGGKGPGSLVTLSCGHELEDGGSGNRVVDRFESPVVGHLCGARGEANDEVHLGMQLEIVAWLG